MRDTQYHGGSREKCRDVLTTVRGVQYHQSHLERTINLGKVLDR